MFESLLQIGDLAAQLAHRRFVLCILLLHLGEVLHLDSLTFEDSSLHVLYDLFLLLPQILELELHFVNLFLHDGDLRLADFRVEFGLHLGLELDLPLPEEDLSFSLYDLSKNLCLFISERLNLVL